MSVYKSDDLINFGCLHPCEVFIHGELRSVPCRQCSYCRTHQAQLLSFDAKLEMSQPNTFTSFVTLTYSNSNVPKVNYKFDGDFIDFFTDDGEVLDTSFATPKDIKFLRKLSLNYANRFPRYFRFRQIPVVNMQHVQDFVKRVRERFFRKYSQRPRYMFCAEYGESSFRPHYHLLFFSESVEQQSYINEIVSSCWHYGRSHSVSFHGCKADYLSSYCVGLGSVASIYSKGYFRARARHSQNFGLASLDKMPFFCQKFTSGIPIKCSDFIDGQLISVFPTHVFENSVFPKCRNFNGASVSELRKRYLLKTLYFAYYRGVIDFPTDSLLAKHIYNELQFYKYNPQTDKPLYASIFALEVSNICDNPQRLFNQIYFDVRASSKFLEACRLYSDSNKFIHLYKTIRYYQHKYLLNQNDNFNKISYLKKIGDTDAIQYFTSNFQKSHMPSLEGSYLKSESFRTWQLYCDSVYLDCSKSKKQKEKYTLKDYE